MLSEVPLEANTSVTAEPFEVKNAIYSNVNTSEEVTTLKCIRSKQEFATNTEVTPYVVLTPAYNVATASKCSYQ